MPACLAQPTNDQFQVSVLNGADLSAMADGLGIRAPSSVVGFLGVLAFEWMGFSRLTKSERAVGVKMEKFVHITP